MVDSSGANTLRILACGLRYKKNWSVGVTPVVLVLGTLGNLAHLIHFFLPSDSCLLNSLFLVFLSCPSWFSFYNTIYLKQEEQMENFEWQDGLKRKD